MHNDESASYTQDSAMTELQERLQDGLVRSGLTKTQLAGRTRLSRTTVQQAFQTDGQSPSAQTVGKLARELKLPVEELLALHRDATTDASSENELGPGRQLGQWDPYALEVHLAGTADGGTGSSERPVLPGYVKREHDRVLAKVVREAGQGRSRMLVLTGDSSTGKTRACWEAVQPLAENGWRLWHPFDPTRAEAAIQDLHRVGPRTVVWLNEAQHYFGDPSYGERIAAAIHTLLVQPERGPVLVLGTLWPEYAGQYMSLPEPGGGDPHSRVRELLAGRTLSVPDAFDGCDLASASDLAEAGDSLLADALPRARGDGRLTQDLAGVPALLERYRNASPMAKALLQAAMDARRLGVGPHIPQVFLTTAATDYLHDNDWEQLDETDKAYAELAKRVHGKQAPLRRVNLRPQQRPPGTCTRSGAGSPSAKGPVLGLADSLEQHGRTTRRHLCPPASFWHAAHTHLTYPTDLAQLARAADKRHRRQWAHHLYQRAADHGSAYALAHFAKQREIAGDREGAETLARQAADHGHFDALLQLAVSREIAGDREGAETLYRLAVDYGETTAMTYLAEMRESAGDREGAEALFRKAIKHGSPFALTGLAALRESAGDREGAEALARQAADHGDTFGLARLAEMRESAGDREGAEALFRKAIEYGDTFASARLAQMREFAGDQKGAESFARQALEHGDITALAYLAEMRESAGDREGAEPLFQQAIQYGSASGLTRLATMRERVGDRNGAETLYRYAIKRGDSSALSHLAEMRESEGDREGAEFLAREALDRGDAIHLAEMVGEFWPYGLNPDGTPSPQWH